MLAPAPSRDADLVPGQRAGEYCIEAKIGQGGMGTVYRARHPVIGKRAAIKVLRSDLSASQESVDRFVQEAQAVNQIEHANIVDVFGFGRLEDGRFFFIMDLLVGQSLRDRMMQPLPLADAIEIIDTIAKTLQATHDAGVIHRDLKPDNVFLVDVKDDRPMIKLLDFGLAKLNRSEQAAGRTRTGVVMGTPLYVSPEQAKCGTIEPPTDIYSLGAVAYEMVTGRVPFTAESSVEIMAAHISDPPVPLRVLVPALRPEIEAIVLAMLAKEPAHRPTLRQIREALAGVRAGYGRAPTPSPWPVSGSTPRAITNRPVRRASTVKPAPRNHRLILGIVVALGLVGGVVLAVALAGGSDTPEPAKPAPAVVAQPQPQPPPPPKPEAPKPAPAEPAPITETPPPPTEAAREPTEPIVQPARTKTTEPPKPVVKAAPRPEPPKSTVPGMVRITIEGGPAGQNAALFVDGNVVPGRITSSWTLSLSSGRHRLRAIVGTKHAGDAVVDVEPAKVRNVTIRLSLSR